MLYTQPRGIDHSYLIHFYDAKIRFLEPSWIRPVGKTPSLSDPGNRKHVVDSAVEGFKSLLEGGALRLPVCDISDGSPDASATATAFVDFGGERLESGIISIRHETIDPALM